MRLRVLQAAQKPLPWILFLAFQLLSLKMIKNNPQLVEEYYSSFFYPLLFQIQSRFFAFFSFSLGDLFYALALLLFLYNCYRYFKYKKQNFKWLFFNLIILVSLIHFFFYMSWGLNYFRIPLHQKLNYTLDYTEESLTKTLLYHLDQTHRLRQQLNTADSLAVVAPYNKKKIIGLIQENYTVPFHTQKKVTPFGKVSWWSYLLSYAGYGGYLNPFTLESQINNLQPPLSFVSTAAHEMAHQCGIAAEDEANFIAFYILAQHTDPYLRFSAHAFAVRYLYYDLYRFSPETAKEIRYQMHPGLLKDFEKIAIFWKQFENPFEPYLKQFYHQFLVANGQKKGLKSYSAIVGYLVAHCEENSTLK